MLSASQVTQYHETGFIVVPHVVSALQLRPPCVPSGSHP